MARFHGKFRGNLHPFLLRAPKYIYILQYIYKNKSPIRFVSGLGMRIIPARGFGMESYALPETNMA